MGQNWTKCLARLDIARFVDVCCILKKFGWQAVVTGSLWSKNMLSASGVEFGHCFTQVAQTKLSLFHQL
jgi:hypothetical protein